MASVAAFRYALSANSTSTGFTAQNSTSTEPSGTGVFDLGAPPYGSTQNVPTYLQLIPFGTDGANDTFDMRVYGYSATVPTDLVTDTAIYVPQLLLDVSVVLGARTFSDHAANTLLADTLTVNDGAADNGPWRSLIDCQGDMVASVIIHTRGCRYIKFDWDLAGAQEAVSMNCLWRPLDF